VAGRWFSPGTPVSSINETDRHDISETDDIVESGVKLHNLNPNLKIAKSSVLDIFCHLKFLSPSVIYEFRF
jgi:hypothetical protein